MTDEQIKLSHDDIGRNVIYHRECELSSGRQ